MRKKQLLIVMGLLLSNFLIGQSGAIKGTVKDTEGNGVPFANIILSQNGYQVAGTTTNFDGNYILKPVPVGKFDLTCASVGYQKKIIKGIIVSADKTRFLDIEMSETSIKLDEIEVVEYKVPLISKDQTCSGGTITMSTRRVRGARSNSSTVGGVYQKNVNVKSNRAEARGEKYGKFKPNKFNKVSRAPVSTFSIDVDAASYSNVRRFLNGGHLPPVDAVRVEEMINYFKYDYPQPGDEYPFSINTEIGKCPWDSDNLLLHIGLQGKEIETSELPPSNLVFLIDVSGSMSWDDKLPLVKKAFRMLVKKLRPQDRVGIVVYAGSSGLVLKSTKGDKKAEILEAIDCLEAGGSTAGGAGIRLAYKVAKKHYLPRGNNRVILATDGDFNVGVSSNSELEKLIVSKRDEGIFLSVLGFGTGNYQDEKMETLADKGNGNYSYIDNLMEARKVFVNEFGGTLFTIAKDVKIQIEFNPHFVKSYRLVGYENRLLNREDFDDDKKDAGELGSGHSVTALYEIVPNSSAEKIENDLKYQSSEVNELAVNSGEIGTVKFRYKKPKGKESKLITQPIKMSNFSIDELSDNFKFSSAVAGFGMYLRKSEYLKKMKLDDLIQIASGSRGIDSEGYRSEFLQLMKLTKDL